MDGNPIASFLAIKYANANKRKYLSNLHGVNVEYNKEKIMLARKKLALCFIVLAPHRASQLALK